MGGAGEGTAAHAGVLTASLSCACAARPPLRSARGRRRGTCDPGTATVCLRLASLFLLAVASGAAAAPSFRVERAYPNLGLRMRMLAEADPEPLKPPHIFFYERVAQRNGEAVRTRFEAYDPHALWFATQHGGQWRDAKGNRLVLGRADRQCPVFAAPHVTREAFDRALAAVERVDPASRVAVVAWVRAFANVPLGEPELLKAKPFGPPAVLFFPHQDPQCLVYAFRPRGSIAGRPAGWYAAILTVADGTPAARARDLFEQQFLATVAAGGSGTANAVGATTLAPASGARRAGDDDHPSRDAARRSIANLKDWWSADLPGYIILSDIRSSAGRRLISDLQRQLPHLKTAFERLVPPRAANRDVHVIRIFEDPGHYRAYVGEARAWSAGIWEPGRRELVLLFRGEQRAAETMSVIFHEGFHQYLHYAYEMKEAPVWFNEGHACLFEAAGMGPRGSVALRESASRTRLILADIDAAAERLPQILQMSYDQFYGGGDEFRNLNYAVAWGLVYYLRKGATLRRNSRDAQLLSAITRSVTTGEDPRAAAAAALAFIDLSGRTAG